MRGLTVSCLIVVGLLLPMGAMAWDPVNPDRVQDGLVSVTRVVDVMYAMREGGEPIVTSDGHWWIAFEDADLLAACRQLSNRPEAGNLHVGVYAGRYVRVPPELLPLVLFARAHNQAARVKLWWDGRSCDVTWFQTCADPNNCQGAVN